MEFQGPPRREEEPLIEFSLLLLTFLWGSLLSTHHPARVISVKQESDPVTSCLKSLPRFPGSLCNSASEVLQDPTGASLPCSTAAACTLCDPIPPHTSRTFIHYELLAVSLGATYCHASVPTVSSAWDSLSAPSNFIQHISQVGIETSGVPGSALLTGDTVGKVASYSPSLLHLTVGRRGGGWGRYAIN